MNLSCTVCGSRNSKSLFNPERPPGPVVSCVNCGHVYVTPVIKHESIIFDGPVLGGQSHSMLFSDLINDIEHCWEKPLIHEKQNEYPASRLNYLDALKRIDQYIGDPGRVLDFGCGAGFFLGVCVDLGWGAYGLEPLPGHAVYARSNFGVQVVTDTLRNDTFEKNYFDLITAFQVFEHLPDPRVELEKLIQILKPGGLILIEVPNIDTWSVKLLRKRHRHFVSDHLNFFSAHTLKLLFNNLCLETLEVYFPTRKMTIHHFLTFWGRKYLPLSFSGLLNRFTEKFLLSDKNISINLYDIVAIIGRKPFKESR